MDKLVVGLILLLLPSLSFATAIQAAPEPEVVGLLVGGAVVWAIVPWRKRK